MLDRSQLFSLAVGVLLATLGTTLALANIANWSLAALGIALVAFTATQLSRTAQPALFPAKAAARREQ